jgi:hypothetical protein
VHKALPKAALKHLEELMAIAGYEYQSDFARTYVAEGRAEGRAEGIAARGAADVLLVLQARKVDVSDDARARITRCTDPDQLAIWLQRAARADSIEDVLR